MTPHRTASLAAVLGSALLLVMACEKGPPPETTSTANLKPLPAIPDQNLLDAPVGVQFRIRHQRVQDLLAGPDPSDEDLARTFGELGMLYLAYGYWEPAAACLSNASRLSPDHARWAYFSGLVQRRLGQFDAADASFEIAVRLDRRNSAALTWIAENALDDGDLDRADAYFTRAADADRVNARALLGRGRVAIERGHLDVAAEFMEQARTLQPLAAEIQHTLGLIYRGQGDLDRARVHFDEARRSRTARDTVAMADRYADELAALRQGSQAHDQRALEAILTGDAESAIAEYRLALDADPQAHDIRYNLGLILIQTGRRAAGLSEFRLLLEQEPDHIPTLIRLGYESTLDSKLGEAESYIRHAAEVDPGSLDAHLLLGDFLEHTGRYQEAAQAYDTAIDIDPSREQAYLGAAISLARAGRADRALETVTRGLAVLAESEALAQLRRELTTKR